MFRRTASGSGSGEDSTTKPRRMLVKIDVEGMEAAVLRGMRKLLIHCRYVPGTKSYA
jgi:hypothetical protein